MQQELETLKKWIDNSDNIVFRWRRRVHGEWDSGFPECGRSL